MSSERGRLVEPLVRRSPEGIFYGRGATRIGHLCPERVRMNESPRGVVCDAVFEIVPPDTSPSPVTCRLSYEETDPVAVTARFTLGEQTVGWTFARALLLSGMYEPVGDGDIAVRPGVDADGHATVYVELSSPHGAALLRTRTSQVATFLAMTQQVVPIGQELDGVDMDAVVSRLLHQASA